MQYVVKILVSVCLLVFSLPVRSELLVVKKGSEGFEPVSLEDKVAGQKISDIILKYEWPGCIASDLTEQEKNELFATDNSYAQEKFIRKKIHQALGEQYDVFFMPTSLYELFCLHVFLSEGKNSFKELWLKELKFLFEPIDLSPLLNREGSPQEIRKRVLDEYRKRNAIFFNKDKGASPFIRMNKSIVDMLFSWQQGLKLCKDGSCVSRQLVGQVPHILTRLVRDIVLQKSKESLLQESFFTRLELEQKDTFIKQVVDLEYEAEQKNRALLFRGNTLKTQSMAINDEGREIKLMGSTLLFGDVTLIKDAPYSISFGNSLFAGIVRDPGACVYSFLTQLLDEEIFPSSSVGYTLFVDKKAYVEHSVSNLFFIAPLQTLPALFATGEFFHSRSKVAVKDKKIRYYRVKGLSSDDIVDVQDVEFFEITYPKFIMRLLPQSSEFLGPVSLIIGNPSKAYKIGGLDHFFPGNMRVQLAGKSAQKKIREVSIHETMGLLPMPQKPVYMLDVQPLAAMDDPKGVFLGEPRLFKISGLASAVLLRDATGIFVFVRDPLRHAELFSRYLVDNGRLIVRGSFVGGKAPSGELIQAYSSQEFVQSQEDLAQFYRSVRRVIPHIKRYMERPKRGYTEENEDVVARVKKMRR